MAGERAFKMKVCPLGLPAAITGTTIPYPEQGQRMHEPLPLPLWQTAADLTRVQVGVLREVYVTDLHLRATGGVDPADHPLAAIVAGHLAAGRRLPVAPVFGLLEKPVEYGAGVEYLAWELSGVLLFPHEPWWELDDACVWGEGPAAV